MSIDQRFIYTQIVARLSLLFSKVTRIVIDDIELQDQDRDSEVQDSRF